MSKSSGTLPPQLTAAPICRGLGLQSSVRFLSLPVPPRGGMPRVNPGCAPSGAKVGERCPPCCTAQRRAGLTCRDPLEGSVPSQPRARVGAGPPRPSRVSAWRGALGCLGEGGFPSVELSRSVSVSACPYSVFSGSICSFESVRKFLGLQDRSFAPGSVSVWLSKSHIFGNLCPCALPGSECVGVSQLFPGSERSQKAVCQSRQALESPESGLWSFK